MSIKTRLLLAVLAGVMASILFYPVMEWLGITLDPKSPVPLLNGIGVFLLVLLLPLLARKA